MNGKKGPALTINGQEKDLYWQWMDRRTRNNDGWNEGGPRLTIDGRIKYVGNGWTEKRGIGNG